jgi:hypothetical protein
MAERETRGQGRLTVFPSEAGDRETHNTLVRFGFVNVPDNFLLPAIESKLFASSIAGWNLEIFDPLNYARSSTRRGQFYYAIVAQCVERDFPKRDDAMVLFFFHFERLSSNPRHGR